MTRPPPMTHEAAAHVFGFLADFAGYYPALCEGDQIMYRDLARAALWHLREENLAEDLDLAPAIDRAMYQLLRAQVAEPIGDYLLGLARKAGVEIEWNTADGLLYPSRQLPEHLRQLMTRHREEIKAAKAAEALAG